MNRSLVLSAVMTGAVFASGCDGCNKQVPNAADAAPPASDAAPPPRPPVPGSDAGAAKVPWASVPSATANILPNMGIPDRFQIEASSRPANIKPNIESVYAALSKAGISVVDKKQHLGQTFGARYCMGARAVKGTAQTDPTLVWFSVCEFVSNDVAEMSREYSTTSLKQIQNRVIHVKAQTTLTVREEVDTPEAKALLDKALAAYDAL